MGVVPPAIAGGAGVTVNTVVAIPDGPEKVIIDVPAVCPLTTAVPLNGHILTVATAGLLLVHVVPTLDVSKLLLSILLPPTQEPDKPTIAPNELPQNSSWKNKNAASIIFFIMCN
jgi:hypothetical protein